MSSGRFIRDELLVVTYSERSEAFYGFSSRHPRDIIIDSHFGAKDLVGKWVTVPLDERKRARAKVTIIEDKFPTRVRYKQVQVKCKIRYDGHGAGNTEMFYHEYFGLIGDTDGVLWTMKEGTEFDVWISRFKEDRLGCRWKVADEQDSIQPCVRDDMGGCGVDNSIRLEKVEGIITGYSRMNGFFLAWSGARPKSTICVDPNFCPQNGPIIGRWAEMEIDENNRVHKPVSFVRERYETRVMGGSAEMFVVFQHIKRYQQEFEMFHTEYFGMISDTDLMVENLENGGWYKGWIQYSQHCGARTCWRLSFKQVVQGPYKTRPDYFHNDPIHSFDYDNERSRRSPSPNYGNDRNSRASSRNRYSPSESLGHRNEESKRSSYGSNKIRNSDYVYVPSGIPYVEQQDSPPSTFFSNGQARPLRHQRTDQYDTVQDRDADIDNLRRSSPRTLSPVGNKARSSSILINSLQEKRGIHNGESDGTRFADNESVANTADSTQFDAKLNEERKEVEKKLWRISNLVKTFTDDDSVSISMSLWSLDDYDELAALVNNYSGNR